MNSVEVTFIRHPIGEEIIVMNETPSNQNRSLYNGSVIMLIGAVSFIGYAVVFLIRSFSNKGFELGVTTLNGVTREQLDALNPGIVLYIGHLHIALSGFIAATGIAAAALAWYGVRRGLVWAWIAAVISPVVALAVALPSHYMGNFKFDWVSHLGPIYLGTLIFVVGALIALKGLLLKYHAK